MVKRLFGDAAIFVASIAGIPLAILVVGTPIVLVARLLIEIARRLP